MSDLVKCLTVVGLCAAGYLYSEYHGSQERKLDAVAAHRCPDCAHKLVMLQGQPAQPGCPVILEFWGIYCAPFVASIPHLNELYARFGPRVQFVAVSGDDVGVVKAFTARQKISYPVAVDTGHDFFKAWDVKSVPTLIFLDSNQKMQWRGHSMQMTDARLASLLGGS